MVRRIMVATALLAALTIPQHAFAHPGHVHKVMGTVVTVHENHLEVKATDGKTSAITLNEKTKILRGKAKAAASDIKSGQRVVVTATEEKGGDGKSMMIASEVRLSEASASR